MICGTSLQTLILLYMIYITNWNKEVFYNHKNEENDINVYYLLSFSPL